MSEKPGSCPLRYVVIPCLHLLNFHRNEKDFDLEDIEESPDDDIHSCVISCDSA